MQLLAPLHELLQCEAPEAHIDPRRDDNDPVFYVRLAHDLEAAERREEHLPLVGVLRHPAEVGANVDAAHQNLKDCAAPPVFPRVLHRNGAVRRRRHQAPLHAAPEALLLAPELVREQDASQPAVHAAVLRHLGQLGELDDAADDAEDGRLIPVALQRRSHARGKVVTSQDGVVPDVHGAGVQAKRYHLCLPHPSLLRPWMLSECL